MGNGLQPRDGVRLSFEFWHRGPLSLNAFAGAISRLDSRYRRGGFRVGPDAPSELLITEIRPGSTIVDLIDWVPIAQTAIGTFGGAHTLIEFGRDVAGLLTNFRKPVPSVADVSITDCDDVRALVRPAISADHGGLTISVVGDNNIVQPVFLQLDKQGAREIDNRAAIVRLDLQQQAEHLHPNVLLTWFQVRDAPGAQEGRPTPDRGVIIEIDGRPLPVRFADPSAKEAMIGGTENPFHHGYIVDVKVLVGPRGPSAYLVLKLHGTIPLDSAA